MQSNDNNNNRGTHGDSLRMLGEISSSNKNPPASAVGSVKWCKSYKKCFNVMMHRGKTRTAGKNFWRLARMCRQADRRWGGRPVPPEWKEKDNADE